MLEREGMRIPPGYTSIDKWEEEHPGETAPESALRTLQEVIDLREEDADLFGISIGPREDKIGLSTEELRRRMEFVFDESNEAYQHFLDQCRKDSDQLQQALQQELEARGAKVWVRLERRPKDKRDYRRMAFMIRPLLFTSSDKAERVQADDKTDKFVIHIDQKHFVQRARSWASDYINTRNFRLFLRDSINEQKDFFQEHYGDWGAREQKISDMIIDLMDVIDPADQNKTVQQRMDEEEERGIR